MVKAYYTIEVRDKKGRVIKRATRKAHSYVAKLLGLIWIQAYQTGTVSMYDISYTARNIPAASQNLDMAGAAGDTNKGAVFGSGSTAVDIADYELETLIAHGTGTGQLSYGANAISGFITITSGLAFTITRAATNNSGAPITVREIGLHAVGYITSELYFLICRDVLASPFSVPNLGAITVVYTLKVVV